MSKLSKIDPSAVVEHAGDILLAGHDPEGTFHKAYTYKDHPVDEYGITRIPPNPRMMALAKHVVKRLKAPSIKGSYLPKLRRAHGRR